MPPFHKPTAYEVSFHDEEDLDVTLVATPSPSSGSERSGSKKRTFEFRSDERDGKRRHLEEPRETYYRPKQKEIQLQEREDLIIPGEEPGEDDDPDDKPIRILSDFSIFDPRHGERMVSLGALEENDGVDREFEAVGYVLPHFLNDEDEGQEDGLVAERLLVRLTAILRYTIDYTKSSDPIYIETVHAWYILGNPSQPYKPFFRVFYTPHRIAQLAISFAFNNADQTYTAFRDKFVTTYDRFLQKTLTEMELKEAASTISDVLDEFDGEAGWRDLRQTPFLRELLRRSRPTASNKRPTRRHLEPVRRKTLTVSLSGNKDLAVLKSENQTPTHVTPLIAELSSDFYREQFEVVGPRPPPQNRDLDEQQKVKEASRLKDLVQKVLSHRGDVIIRRDQRGMRFLPEVTVDGETYAVGDAVLVQAGPDGSIKPPELPHPDKIPPGATIADYFWFGRIIWINRANRNFHLQWFQHSSKTFQEEVSDPQQLFILDSCDILDLSLLIAKVVVHASPTDNVPTEHFFYRFVYDSLLGSTSDIDATRSNTASSSDAPNNCPSCLLAEHKETEKLPLEIKGGVAYFGQTYHLNDFVLIRTKDDSGPCDVGYITKIDYPKASHRSNHWEVTVKRVGRVSSLKHFLPQDEVKDERHLFMTDEVEKVKIGSLIRVCYVFVKESLSAKLPEWLSQSPDHFYMTYSFPSLQPRSWGEKNIMRCTELHLCSECLDGKLKEIEHMKQFLASVARSPPNILDLFGGVGGFSVPFADIIPDLKVTHTIEISPSAAKTFMRNSPDTIVYNQCSNKVLKYSIKAGGRHYQPESFTQIYDDTVPLPPPLKPGSWIMMVAFPCQSYSDLNMYKKADDIKSNLILNALSWVDFLRPNIVFFENVPGFLRHNLNATQASHYRVEGGIVMGGLKHLCYVLNKMGYQYRFSLLHAGHYGIPQTRTRFFLIAALSGYPLPELPQPSHDFPLVDTLEIKFPTGQKINPIRTTHGTAPLPPVTIDDAIGDLRRFDWKNPRPHLEPPEKRRESQRRQQQIPTFECKKVPLPGYKGPATYEYSARTTYQTRSRLHPTTDIQHFTRCLISKKVERVVTIPLNPGADYRLLRPDLYEFQFANPSSAVAKQGYRPGLYGRLDKDGFFPTTVTNMDPTAKQSRVLNPYCKRMVTVRELARSQGFPDSFVFESINNDVVTMHRQIGNAVPWLVATALARELRDALFKRWLTGREQAIRIDDD